MIYYRYWNKYSQSWVEYNELRWWMIHTWKRFMYRHQKTQQERVRWFRDLEEDVRLRKRRAPSHLDRWSDLEKYPTCYYMKSWKKLHKKRKQWM